MSIYLLRSGGLRFTKVALLLRPGQRHLNTNSTPRDPKLRRHVQTPSLPLSSQHSLRPDKITVRYAIQAIRLKWRNALPWRIKWSKGIACIGIVITAGLGAIWVKFQEEVPFSGRKRLNLFGSGDSQKYLLGYIQKRHLCITNLERILALAPQKPGLIWPDDHPATIVVKSVFSRLVVSSGVDPAGWMIYIANAPGRCQSCLFKNQLLNYTRHFQNRQYSRWKSNALQRLPDNCP